MKKRFNIPLFLFLIGLLLSACQPKESGSGSEEANSQPDDEIEIGFEEVTFPSNDSLPISAEIYLTGNTSDPVIVLCHQARFNKFEYAGIAPKLVELGFNCIAIDQRSGGPISTEINETKIAAEKAGLGTDFLDARQDITAAVNYAANRFEGKLILWGSSYSSTLVLYEAVQNEKVDVVVSFSPGDYFADDLGSLSGWLSGFSKSMFVTSSKQEAEYLSPILEKVNIEGNGNQVQFIPEEAGHHGSRALWPNQDGGEEYWEAITSFLQNIR